MLLATCRQSRMDERCQRMLKKRIHNFFKFWSRLVQNGTKLKNPQIWSTLHLIVNFFIVVEMNEKLHLSAQNKIPSKTSHKIYFDKTCNFSIRWNKRLFVFKYVYPLWVLSYFKTLDSAPFRRWLLCCDLNPPWISIIRTRECA